MGLINYTIGELVELTTEVNTDNKFGPDDVRGMTITKQIIPTKADVLTADLSRFLVIHPNQFIFNPRTHGKRIGFGFNSSCDSFIISWNNIGFRIKKDKQEIVLPEYLFLHFNRSEWDREACYRSWGTSTEVFSWDALCEMKMGLPSLSIQQKYVGIYEAMIINQKSYECGLEDLRLTIDSQLDRVKTSSRNRPIMALLHEIDNRNTDGAIKNVQGINITKQFMPSVADTNGVNLKNYKVVQTGQFAFSGMQTGRDECIRLALYRGNEPIIISPAYSVFEANEKEVLAEYIMTWFSRAESDRRGWFMSDSSIRTNLDLDRFYEIEIPVPDMKTQKIIADLQAVYVSRSDINEKLKRQIKDICPILIKGSLEDN